MALTILAERWGNGISKLFFTIISAVAEAERDRIVQRILDGEAAAIAVEMIALAAIRPPHRPA